MTTSTVRQSGLSQADDTVETLKADISKLTDTVKMLASEQLGSVAEGVQDAAANKMSDLEAAIRKSPTQAAAIAAGIGFVVGLIMTR